MLTTLLALAIFAILAGLSNAVVDTSHLFPPIEGRGHAVKDPNSKSFTGTGGNLLMVPGCRSVSSVRVGDTSLPATMPEEYPVSFDSNGNPKLELHDVPMYQLVDTEDGPALQRSVKSNDGIWQAGVPVYVSGQWGEPKAKKEETAKPTKAEEDAKAKAEVDAAAAKAKAEVDAAAAKAKAEEDAKKGGSN